MDFSHYTNEPVQTAVDLVNTYDEADGTERLTSVRDVEHFLEAHAAGWPEVATKVEDKDLHEMRGLRSRLRAVFEANSSELAISGLNSILVDVEATPRVSLHNGTPHLHFEPVATSPARWMGAVTAMGLSVVLIESGLDRIGVCASTTCRDVYVDKSRNRSRRHCSDTCSTRENVAAYRRRQRGTEEG